jgi:hypothetical protein
MMIDGTTMIMLRISWTLIAVISGDKPYFIPGFNSFIACEQLADEIRIYGRQALCVRVHDWKLRNPRRH